MIESKTFVGESILNFMNNEITNKRETKGRKNVPTGIKVTSDILFSIFVTI
jgi:hypothetical protein